MKIAGKHVFGRRGMAALVPRLSEFAPSRLSLILIFVEHRVVNGRTYRDESFF